MIENHSEESDITISAPKKALSSNDYIYIPSQFKTTLTLTRILKYVADRQKQIASEYSITEHPNYYFSLDELEASIQNDGLLSDKEKTKNAVEEALKQMLDLYSSGKVKYGYLYPVLISSNNKIIAKIVIISPQIEHETPVYPLRTNAFAYSQKVIDSILANKVKNTKETRGNHPFQLLLKNLNSEEVLFFPKALSLENDITLLLKKAFLPFSYIPMNDFMDDFLSYAEERGRLIKIVNDYHLVDEEIVVDSEGKFIEEPVIFKHYFTQMKALESIVINFLYDTARDNDFTLSMGNIDSHKNIFDSELGIIPSNEINRQDSLEKIINEFPLGENLTEVEKKNLISCRYSIEILRSLQNHFDEIEEKRQKAYIQLYIDSICNKAIEHCKEKNTLFILDIASAVKSAKISSSGLGFYLEKELRSIIMDRFGYQESKTNDGKLFYYLAYIPIISKITYNLHRLSFHNESYQKQFEIAQLIHGKLELLEHSDLDSEISDKDRAILHKDSILLDRRIKEREKKELRNETYNFKVGITSLLFSIMYFLILYGFFKHMILIYLTLPISVSTGYILARIFSKRGFSSKKNDHEGENYNQEEFEENVSKASAETIFKTTSSSIEEKIFDNFTLRESILLNLPNLKNKIQPSKKDFDENKFIALIEKTILQKSALIHIPKEIVPNNKPSTIIISKEDMKSPNIREKISEYYHFKRSAARSSDGKNNLFLYYNFLYNAIDRDYFKYLKH